jgi:hypothetical protein
MHFAFLFPVWQESLISFSLLIQKLFRAEHAVRDISFLVLEGLIDKQGT